MWGEQKKSDDLQYVGMIGEGVEVFADTGDIDVTFAASSATWMIHAGGSSGTSLSFQEIHFIKGD